MELLPIGSVVKSNGIELIITGYHLNEEVRSYRMYYIVSFFPVGYIPGQPKSQAFLPADKDYEVCFRGYSDEYGESHLARLSERAESLREMDPKVMNIIIEETNKRMEAKSK